MRTLITGGAGLLGRTLIREVPPGVEVHATQRRSPVRGCPAHRVDLADGAAVDALFDQVRPALAIHTAYSAEAGERDILEATRNVVDAAQRTGAALVHVSTDMVFDGESAPYAEDRLPAPVHEYGRWKARAEEYVRGRDPGAVIVRASLLTSFDPPDPRTAWVRAGLRGEAAVALFTDEIRSPIVVDDLARQIWEIVSLGPAERAGVWHLAGPEALSRYAIGALIAAYFGETATRITPARSADSAAPRPRDLRLATARADRALRTRARALSELLNR